MDHNRNLVFERFWSMIELLNKWYFFLQNEWTISRGYENLKELFLITFVCSLGWLRLLHQCLSVSTLNSNLATEVLNSAASVEGLVEACCNLLLLPAPSLFTANLERVLLQLGLHSRELGLHLIGLLLNNRSTPFFQGIASWETFSIFRKQNQRRPNSWTIRQILKRKPQIT